MNTILADVKTLLGIEDMDLDEKLKIMIEHAGARVLSLLVSDEETVPDELKYIVCELTVSRFNRLGNEGMDRFDQDGESITYGDDIEQYMPAIDAWNAQYGKGRIRFI
ncbi:MAG: phage head-tail connector protein [Bacteroidales bacterium]|nr:phage head-tail connector protein [Bacteroidales bacterium]